MTAYYRDEADVFDWLGVRYAGKGYYITRGGLVERVEKCNVPATSTSPRMRFFSTVVSCRQTDDPEPNGDWAHPFVEDTNFTRIIAGEAVGRLRP